MAKVKKSVYTIKQAEKFNGKWNKKLSTVQREGMKLSAEEAKSLNANFDVSGRYYDLDEKATKVYVSSIK